MDNAVIKGLCSICNGAWSRHINLSSPLDHKFVEGDYRRNPQGELVRIERTSNG